MPNQTERPEPLEIDINDTSLIDGSPLEYDLNEDFQARAVPPPGRSDPGKPKFYKFRVFIEDTKIEKHLKQGFDPKDPNGYYYKKQVVCKIQDETGKWQDSVVFGTFSSGIPQGKKISTMLGFLKDVLGIKVQQGLTELGVAKFFIKALTSYDGPTAIAECDWSCWDSNNTKRNDFGSIALISKTGKLANTMLNFPKRADGTYEHIIYTKEGAELIAKLKIMRWVPKAKVKKSPVPVAVVSQPKPVVPAEDAEVQIGDDGEVVLDF